MNVADSRFFELSAEDRGDSGGIVCEGMRLRGGDDVALELLGLKPFDTDRTVFIGLAGLRDDTPVSSDFVEREGESALVGDESLLDAA